MAARSAGREVAGRTPVRNRRHLLVVACMGLAGVWGCGGHSEYEIRMNQPWLDEYTTSGRTFSAQTLLLPPPMVAWHGAMDPHDVIEQVVTAAGGRKRVYVFARRELARRRSGPGPARIWVVEARLGRRYFEAEALEPIDLLGERPLGEVLGLLGEWLGREIRLGSEVRPETTVKLDLRGVDPREALAGVLAQQKLFVREWEYLPLTLRSYEYASAGDFVRAAAEVADELERRPVGDVMTVVPFRAWHAQAAQEQRRLMDVLAKKLKGRRKLGEFTTSVPLPTPTFLAPQEYLARRQALFALAAQIAPGAGGG